MSSSIWDHGICEECGLHRQGLLPRPSCSVTSYWQAFAYTGALVVAAGLTTGILCIVAGLLWYWHRLRRRCARNGSEQAVGDVTVRLGVIDVFSSTSVNNFERDMPTVEPDTKAAIEAGWGLPPQVTSADSYTTSLVWGAISVGSV